MQNVCVCAAMYTQNVKVERTNNQSEQQYVTDSMYNSIKCFYFYMGTLQNDWLITYDVDFSNVDLSPVVEHRLKVKKNCSYKTSGF